MSLLSNLLIDKPEPSKPTKLRMLSNSQIGTWLRCPRQWEFRYVKGLKLPPKGVMIQGSAYHGALKANFEHKLKAEADLGLTDVLDAFSTYWNERLHGKYGDRGKEEGLISDIDWEGQNPGVLKDEGISLVSEYHRLIAPNIIPIAVESEGRVRIDDSLEILGYIDLDVEKEVIDHKLRGRAFPQADADRDFQVHTYCFLRKKQNFAFHVAIKKKVPEIQIIKVHKTDADINWWLQAVKQVAAQIDSGIAPPNTNGWWCSYKFCGYHSLCQKMRTTTFSFK